MFYVGSDNKRVIFPESDKTQKGFTYCISYRKLYL